MIQTTRASSLPQSTDGAISAWTFDFRIDTKAEAQLVLIGANGVESIVPAAEWAIEGLKQPSGGWITWPLTGAAQPAGFMLRVDRVPVFTQDITLTTQGAYDPRVVERGFDASVKRDQFLLGRANRMADLIAELTILVGTGGGAGGIPLAFSLPAITATDLNLLGDGATEDFHLIQAKIDEVAPLGGRLFDLTPPAGVGFRGNGKLRVHGGSVLFLNGPAMLDQGDGRQGGIAIHGAIAADPSANAIRLQSLAVAGATTFAIDTIQHGNVAPSTLLAVGDFVTFTGNLDSCGSPLQLEEKRVTAVSDGAKTITVAAVDAAGVNFQPSYTGGDYFAATGQVAFTTIRKQVTGLLTAGSTVPANKVSVSLPDAAKFALGDLVIVQDRKRCLDIAGTSTALVHRSVARIQAIAGTVITLDRWVEHPLETAFQARITLLDAASGTVGSSTAVFVALPGLVTNVRTFEIAYAEDSYWFDAFVPNEDAFGGVGDALRIKLSVDCAFVGGAVYNPKFLAPGQGYGIIFDWATDCWCSDLTFRGCRHDVVHAGDTRCASFDCKFIDNRLAALDCHGNGSWSSYAVNPQFLGGDLTASGSRVAINFGDTFHLGGATGFRVKGGKVAHYRSPQAVPGTYDYDVLAVIWQPGAVDCRCIGTEFVDIDRVFQVLDQTGTTTLVADRNGLEGCKVKDCKNYVGWLEGNHYTASVAGVGLYQVKDFLLRDLDLYGVGRLFRFTRINGLEITGLRIDGVTVDAGEPYIARGNDVQRFSCERGRFRGVGKGFSFINCPAFAVIANDFADLTNGALLDNQTGNAAYRWMGNRWRGFTAVLESNLSIGTIAPRTFDEYQINSEGYVEVIPPHKRGVVLVVDLNAHLIQAYFDVTASPAVLLAMTIDGDSQVITGATGATAVAGATAGKFALAADPTSPGYLRVINRDGGSRNFNVLYIGEI